MCSTSATNTESRMSVIPPGKKNSMSRLQRKCVVASFTAHALLLALLVVGSAFMKSPPKKEPKHDTPKITENPKTTVPKDTPKPPKHEIEVSLDVKKPTIDPVAERLKAEKARAAKEERIRQEKERQAQERARQDAIDQANREYKKTLEALGNIVGKVD